jgi:hypothetical protein
MQYINKKAFDRGFKDFKTGDIYSSPYELDSINHKEWLRGINFAYALFLKRAKTREEYRKNLNA